MIKKLLIISLLVLLVGCGKVTIDSSSRSLSTTRELNNAVLDGFFNSDINTVPEGTYLLKEI